MSLIWKKFIIPTLKQIYHPPKFKAPTKLKLFLVENEVTFFQLHPLKVFYERHNSKLK